VWNGAEISDTKLWHRFAQALLYYSEFLLFALAFNDYYYYYYYYLLKWFSYGTLSVTRHLFSFQRLPENIIILDGVIKRKSVVALLFNFGSEFERSGLKSSGLEDMWKKVVPVIQEVRRRTIKQVSTVIRTS
jgi:hypothetical protein